MDTEFSVRSSTGLSERDMRIAGAVYLPARVGSVRDSEAQK